MNSGKNGIHSMPTPEVLELEMHHGDVLIAFPDLPDFRLLVHLIGDDGYAPVLLQACCGKWWYLASSIRCSECGAYLTNAHLDEAGWGTKRSVLQWMGEQYTNSLAAELWAHEMLAMLDELVTMLKTDKRVSRMVLEDWTEGRKFPVL